MFKKKECGNCGEALENNYRFCPHCGELKSKRPRKNNGLLGEDDFVDEFEGFSNSLFGNMGSKMMSKMFESAMKMMEKEMQKVNKNDNPSKVSYELFVNGKRVNPKEVSQKREIKETIDLPSNYLKDFSSLPRKEPKTNIRRFSDKVIYEINIPGVKSVDDLSLVKLENSIELKAVAKGKAYHKVIPINMPVVDYEFSDGKLVLELDLRE